jgi:hypothetical protein
MTFALTFIIQLRIQQQLLKKYAILHNLDPPKKLEGKKSKH